MTSKPLKTVEETIEDIWCGALDAKEMKHEFQSVSDYETAYIKYKTNISKQAQSEIYQLMLSLLPSQSKYKTVDSYKKAIRQKLSEHFNGENHKEED